MGKRTPTQRRRLHCQSVLSVTGSDMSFSIGLGGLGFLGCARRWACLFATWLPAPLNTSVPARLDYSKSSPHSLVGCFGFLLFFYLSDILMESTGERCSLLIWRFAGDEAWLA